MIKQNDKFGFVFHLYLFKQYVSVRRWLPLKMEKS